MLRLSRYLAYVVVLVSSQLLLADQVVLSNGDRLTGTITQSDGKNLVIKTEFAGDVTIQWSAVQEINSATPLHVGLKDGRTVAGPVKTSGGTLEVETKDAGSVAVSKDTVTFLRSDAEQIAYEKTLNPGWMEAWHGGANISFALTRGNSATKNLALAFTADRKTLHDHLGLYANSVFATNDAVGAVPHTTANAIQSGTRYDHDLNPRIFGFVAADFQTDDLQDLNLRSVLGGGLGFHAIKSARTTMDLLGGANYTRENYSQFNRNFAALTLGEELTTRLGAATVLTQKLYFYPDLSESGEYRAVFNFGTITKISKWMGWQNAFGDIYVTNPPAGAKLNDLILTTGINLSFGH